MTFSILHCRLLSSLCIWISIAAVRAEDSTAPAQPCVATFSIAAFDPATGDLGVAVQSKFFGVGSVVPWAKAGVGAIATQAYANTTYGPDGLKLLSSGKSAKDVVEILTTKDPRKEYRQLGIVDAEGGAAAFTGSECKDWAGHFVGTNFCAQGNILASEKVAQAMAKAFDKARREKETDETELADWLVRALAAGQEAGGDKRGRQSAALLVVREKGGYAGLNDRYIDIRVEDFPQPIQELGRLLERHRSFFSRP